MSSFQVKDFLSDSLVGVVQKLPAVIQAAKADSLIEYTRPTRVEPTTVVDSNLIYLPYASEILQSLNSIFLGYYMQAVGIMVNINRIDIIGILDSLNPRRDISNANALDNLRQWVSTEELNITFGLPVPGENKLEQLGLEEIDLVNTFASLEARKDDKDQKDVRNPDQPGNAFRDADFVSMSTNLSVGKIVQVEISHGKNKITIPVNVRLLVSPTPSKGVVNLLAMQSQNRTVKERYHAWRSGQLEFWKDLVLVQDLIDEHREGLLNDTSGLYRENLQRTRENRITSLLTLRPSVSNASNLVVISKETERELERKIYAKLSNFRDREKIFKQSYTMIIAVVDPEWEQVTFYHRSISRPTELSIKDIKSINKNKGPDITEILKAFQTGQAPTF